MRKVKEKRARFKTPLGTHTYTCIHGYLSQCVCVCVVCRPCCNPLNNALPAQPSPVQGCYAVPCVCECVCVVSEVLPNAFNCSRCS